MVLWSFLLYCFPSPAGILSTWEWAGKGALRCLSDTISDFYLIIVLSNFYLFNALQFPAGWPHSALSFGSFHKALLISVLNLFPAFFLWSLSSLSVVIITRSFSSLATHLSAHSHTQHGPHPVNCTVPLSWPSVSQSWSVHTHQSFPLSALGC